MATHLKKHASVPSPALRDKKTFGKFRIGIVVANWNPTVTQSLWKGAREYLIAKGIKEKHIRSIFVPGSFELPLGAQWLAARKDIDAVITLGCVVQGETRHFDFICDACANGIMDVGLTFSKPVIFGVLTTGNQGQAKERSGGKHGHKGIEAAETALEMLLLQSGL